MSEFIEVVCTDRSTHPPAVIDTFKVDGDQVETMTTRRARAPWSSVPDAKVEAFGEMNQAPRQMIVDAESHHEDFGEQVKWRFVCPRCGRDKPVSLATAQKVLPQYVAARRKSIDVSMLP